MINIEKGCHWDLPWSLVSGCTPCSPGCDHCWALAMEKRFRTCISGNGRKIPRIDVEVHSERLSIPLKRRKPTVYAVWNDFFNADVVHPFRQAVYDVMKSCPQHTFLILTKRAGIASERAESHPNIYHGLTICNQAEADEKIPVFLQVPGKKFLSVEPCLSGIDLKRWINPVSHVFGTLTQLPFAINAVILGGETGPGARPMHPDWVRSVRDQCAAAGVPFFFKGWGKHLPGVKDLIEPGASEYSVFVFNTTFRAQRTGRLLDGRTHDDLPWRSS